MVMNPRYKSLIRSLLASGVLSACISVSAQGLKDEFPSVSGRYSFRAEGWNAQIFHGGPLSVKNECEGYGSRGESEAFWEYLAGQALSEADAEAREGRLPLWIGIPPWDKGRIERVPASGEVAAHLIIHRTNGRIRELVYLFEEGSGVLCIHVLKPDWSKQDLPVLAIKLYGEAHGKIVFSDKAIQQNLDQCVFPPDSVPTNFEAAVLAFRKLMSPTELERLKNLDGVYGLVETMDQVPTGGILWGPELAGRWGLVDGGSPLAKELNAAGAHAMEDQEAAIILGLQRNLLGRDYRLKAVIRALLHPK